MPPTAKVNNVWGQQTQDKGTYIFTLPSGQTIEMRKVTIDQLLEGGLLAHFENLSALVVNDVVTPAKQQLSGHKGKKPTKAEAAAAQEEVEAIQLSKLLGDPDMMKSIIAMADAVAPLAAVCPPVRLHYHVHYLKDAEGKSLRVVTPLKDDERIPVVFENDEYASGYVYTDQIDFMDKLSLMQEAVDDLANRLAAFQ
jgi:hypothetical protein